MNESNELLARIESLEKKNRRLVRMGSAALVAIAGFGAMSMRSTCDTVSAERFVLLDTQGHQRALLSAYETGGVPQLALYDKKGRAVATLGVEKTGAFLSLADANGERAVRYGVDCGTATGEGCNKTESEKPARPARDTGSIAPQDETR